MPQPQICVMLIENYEKLLLIGVEGIIPVDFIKGQEYVFLCACTVPYKMEVNG